MISNILLLIFLVSFHSFFLFSQFEKVAEVNLNCTFHTSDPEMNIYVISKGLFLKYPPPYEKAFSWNFAEHGQPGIIDVYSIKRVIFFYPNSHKLIILGDTLKEVIRPLYLEEIGMNEISMVFSSENNDLWFYSDFSNTLTKLNSNFTPVIRSLNLNKYFELPNTPSFMFSYRNDIYLNIPSTGIMVIDPNGNYRTGLVMPGLIDFQMDGDYICYFRDNVIYRYHPVTRLTEKVNIPPVNDVLNAHIYDDSLFLFRTDGFIVYKMNINKK